MIRVDDINDKTDKIIINKTIAKLLFGDYLVFDDDNCLMATSKKRLDDSLSSGWIGYDCIKKGDQESFCISLPHYSENIRDAFYLAEMMNKAGYFSLTGIDDKWAAFFFVDISKNNLDKVEYHNIPIAICKAFLRFNNVDEI